MNEPLVGIVIGSRSDVEAMKPARELLDEFQIPHEMKVISAHRTPELTLEYAGSAEARGLEVIIAGAGMAAALPGVLAAKTLVPVLGVPLAASLDGMDALLAMVQMPRGVPVGTLAIGKAGAANAAILAAEIIGVKRPEVRERLRAWREARKKEALAQTDV